MFLVTGCARSGTTSLASILNRANNAVCLIEPAPNLNREGRDLMEGRLSNPEQVVRDTILRRAAERARDGSIYGEKNVNLAPFIPYLAECADCKFVYVRRDGRDVVRSLIDWHNRMFGSIYRECKEPGDLSARAKAAVAALPIEDDSSDYSRPRPQPGDIWYERWEDFSRLEMCAWYWSRINDLFLNQFESVPRDDWTSIDYTSPHADDVIQVINFLELKGVDRQDVQSILDVRINSLHDRIREPDSFPHRRDWQPSDRIRFDKIAGSTMKRLGYD